jgi:hypothetical protein
LDRGKIEDLIEKMDRPDGVTHRGDQLENVKRPKKLEKSSPFLPAAATISALMRLTNIQPLISRLHFPDQFRRSRSPAAASSSGQQQQQPILTLSS